MGEQEVVTVPSQPRTFRVINKKIAIFGFLVLSALLIFYAIAPDTLTGFAVGGPEDDSGEESVPKILVQAEVSRLTAPLESKQNIDEIKLEVIGSPTKLFVGKDGVTDLSNIPRATIIMEDFSGLLGFDGDAVTSLKGTVSSLSINGLPTQATSGEIRLRIDEPLPYDSIDLKGFSLREYRVEEEFGSVVVNGGKVSLAVEQELFVLEDFRGDFRSGSVSNQGIVRDGVSLSGQVSAIEVGGQFQLSLSN